MKRLIGTAIGLCVLGACAPSIPDSGQGAGFDNSIVTQRAREAERAAQPPQSILPSATAISDEVTGPLPGIRVASAPQAAAPVPQTPSAPLEAPMETTATALPPAAPAAQSQDTILAAAASLNGSAAPAPTRQVVEASPSNPAPAIVSGDSSLSDENDFQAVSQRESIESDAQRIEQNRAQYQQIAPTALPQRSGATQPNIVQYALETSHARGTRIYNRTGFNLNARAQRKCAAYASSDQAQIDFLDSGGPRRDRKGLDPDGDGFACSWDPTPFRAAVRN